MHSITMAKVVADMFVTLQRKEELNPINIIRMCDSSTTSVLNWQATELTRKQMTSGEHFFVYTFLIFSLLSLFHLGKRNKDKHIRTMFFSRSYYQLAQCIIEEAMQKLVAVDVDDEGKTNACFIILYLRVIFLYCPRYGLDGCDGSYRNYDHG